ncbi:CLUMA_CG018700, isoform A [Clunio marinus]|uniref:Exocyst complex component 2 n=1 Tax=Clunio marinus TaxID=568069 RepID=A0A1J1IZG8_9DIPT|nr:CLUMA_CG018700, isoform A [Clunio marinus]
MAPPPLVTGISPKEGPPGTKITIRGENLGVKANDLIGVQICGGDCSFEWQSRNKIIARTGINGTKGKGDVIVTSLSGGAGTSTVQFRTYTEMIGPLKESAVWVEESPVQSLAWGRRTMAPSGYSQEDPLGLSIEGNEKKFPDDLREIFPEHSGDLSRENFSPCWFLLENHHATSFDDLKAGYSFLKRKVEGQKEGQLSFLKTHVSAVIDQLDTLMNLKTKMEIEGEIDLAKRVNNLQGTIEKSIESSHELFDDVLSRREKADKARAALSVLNRYKFLFCLPTNIEKNASKNEFDIIVNDYARAKNLYGKSEIPLIQKVLAEVDEIILEIRRKLHQKIQEMPQGVEQQKRFVKSLINLEIQQVGTIQSEKLKIVDPAWGAIESRARYIEQTFKNTYEEFQERENSMKDNSKRDLNAPPIRVLFCEEITEIATGQFPDLWRLGQSYFTGELRGINEPKPGNFKQIILNAIERFCSYVRAAILPQNQKFQAVASWAFTSSSQLQQFSTWLPTCLRYLRVSYASLIRLDLPGEALDIVLKLIDELRLFCLTTILKRAIDKVKKLHEKETWELTVPEFPGATALPSKLEEILVEVLDEGQQICLMMEVRENPLFDTPNSEGHREVAKIVETILSCFSNVVEELATERSDDEVQHMPKQLIGFPTNSSLLPHSINLTEAKSTISSTITITWEHRLLCCLANSAYCNKTFINSLGNLFVKFGYPIPKLALENSRTIVNNVFSNLLEIYVEHKSDPLVSTIEPSMYIVSHFKWNRVEKFDNLSPYTHECLDNVVSVYSEIFAVSPFLLRPILEQIIQTIAEELARLMSCVEEFNVIGKKQATLDIRMIRDVLRVYSNERAKASFNEALESIPKLANDENREVENLLAIIKQQMKLQLMCLTVLNP